MVTNTRPPPRKPSMKWVNHGKENHSLYGVPGILANIARRTDGEFVGYMPTYTQTQGVIRFRSTDLQEVKDMLEATLRLKGVI